MIVLMSEQRLLCCKVINNKLLEAPLMTGLFLLNNHKWLARIYELFYQLFFNHFVTFV